MCISHADLGTEMANINTAIDPQPAQQQVVHQQLQPEPKNAWTYAIEVQPAFDQPGKLFNVISQIYPGMMLLFGSDPLWFPRRHITLVELCMYRDSAQ